MPGQHTEYCIDAWATRSVLYCCLGNTQSIVLLSGQHAVYWRKVGEQIESHPQATIQTTKRSRRERETEGGSEQILEPIGQIFEICPSGTKTIRNHPLPFLKSQLRGATREREIPLPLTSHHTTTYSMQGPQSESSITKHCQSINVSCLIF